MTASIPCASLLDRTLQLVNNAPRSITYTVMANQCGLSIAWISRFAAGKMEDPGVRKVQCLHDYLSNVGN